jgi:predicted DNA-binding protein YlxM (UPF0122 family)
MTFRDDREQKSMIGVDCMELKKIEESFSEVLTKERSTSKRQRAIGGGRKGSLITSQDKVIFCLYYLKNYPTFDVLGNLFHLSRSSAHEALHKWIPILKKSLENLDVMPQSLFENAEQMHAYFEKKK